MRDYSQMKKEFESLKNQNQEIQKVIQKYILFKFSQKLASYEYTYGGYTDVELHTECNYNMQTLQNTNSELEKEIISLKSTINSLKQNNRNNQISVVSNFKLS